MPACHRSHTINDTTYPLDCTVNLPLPNSIATALLVVCNRHIMVLVQVEWRNNIIRRHFHRFQAEMKVIFTHCEEGVKDIEQTCSIRIPYPTTPFFVLFWVSVGCS